MTSEVKSTSKPCQVVPRFDLLIFFLLRFFQ